MSSNFAHADYYTLSIALYDDIGVAQLATLLYQSRHPIFVGDPEFDALRGPSD
jgi:hypothetical protein